MSDHLTKRLPARHCTCGTPTAQPRSVRAVRVAARLAELGLPLDVPLCRLSQAAEPELLSDLGVMDMIGLHRACGWARAGRRMDTMAGAWVS